MKKVTSSSKILERIHNNEPFWVALPPYVLQGLSIGLLCDLFEIGQIAELSESDLEKHKKKFDLVET